MLMFFGTAARVIAEQLDLHLRTYIDPPFVPVDMSHCRLVLGAPDPEMSMIEKYARVTGMVIVYATAVGQRVTGMTTYRADYPVPKLGDIWVECAPLDGGKDALALAGAMSIDHHEPGDAGYGAPPEDFLTASSIWMILWVVGVYRDFNDFRVRVVAACDHCLTAAYAGLCPGVSREAVVEYRASLPGAPTVEQIEAAIAAISSAEEVEIGGCQVKDLRGRVVHGLNHCGPMLGVAYLASVVEPSGRQKVVLGGDGPGTATAGRAASGFAQWAEQQGYTDSYGGDPARGFAGAYRT
jgi:hypothetical protein